MLGEGATDDINDSVGEPEKQFIISRFDKPKPNLCLSLDYKVDQSCCYVKKAPLMIYLKYYVLQIKQKM